MMVVIARGLVRSGLRCLGWVFSSWPFGSGRVVHD